MSVFRPAAKVTSPDGQEWEIYAYRFRWQRPARRRDVFRALATSLRPEWTIDAVTYLPYKMVVRWTTAAEHKGQVLAQVEGTITRGDVQRHLANAVYRGELSRSAR